ncbi:ATP-binding protein [Micromonospora sp. NPDC049559]|uniref:ATP-binding protein n=1 Tax=Micromonospora sp. NPDC049559 TaxID=3155923 RepID=UPI003425756F
MPGSTAPDARVREARSTWRATLALAGLAVAASLAAAVTSTNWVAATVAVGAALATSLVLALAARTHHRLGAALVDSARREAETERDRASFDERLRQREAEWHDQLAARSVGLQKELDHLLRVRLAAALDGSPVPPALDRAAVDGPVAELLDEVLAAATRATEQAGEREESLRLAVVALSRRVQTAAHSIQEQVSLMAGRHQQFPDVVETSMRVDHAAAQQARQAQSLAVLCGEWPGQQWQEPLAMVDVVRAASARILPYERVEVSGDQDVAVAAEVVEPVIHLVAELLANATQSSPPATSVPVTVRRVQRGAVIEIDDGGIGMEEHRLEQAREVVSGRRLIGLGDLGEIPQTGLAVVGHHVRRHGFRADLSESPYGGLRAVVLIPTENVRMAEPVGAATAPPPVRPPVDDEADAGTGAPVEASTTSGGLPRRQSRRGRSARTATAVAADARPTAEPTPEQAGSWMSAFLGGDADGDADGVHQDPKR